MNKNIPSDKLFEHIRQLPLELPFEQIEQFVLAQTLPATPTTFDWTSWFNLKNSILMTGFMIGIGLVTSLFFTDNGSIETALQQQQSLEIADKNIPTQLSEKIVDSACCEQDADFMKTKNYPTETTTLTAKPPMLNKAPEQAIAVADAPDTTPKANTPLPKMELDTNVSQALAPTQKQSSPASAVEVASVTEADRSTNLHVASAKTDETNNKANELQTGNLGNLSIVSTAENVIANISSELPKGWYTRGCSSSRFKVGTDNAVSKSGTSSAFIEALPMDKDKNGLYSENLEQKIDASPYLGKRIRLTGFVKTELEGTSSHAAMKMRTRNKRGSKILTYDYMVSRRIRGNTEWTQYEIVLDVPQRAGSIVYGVGMRGKGKIWIDDFQISVVDKNVPTTDKGRWKNTTPNALTAPTNTNFEEGN